MSKVILKKGKEKALRNRHPWIFSGAIEQCPDHLQGEILPIYSSQGELLGSGYFNSKSSIRGRMLSFGDTPPLEALKRHLLQALALRKEIFRGQKTTAYRLINSEGDGIPGLIVDRYGDLLVLQVGTLGIERLKPQLIELLKELCTPTAIYEKSALPSRKEEGLETFQGVLYGQVPESVSIFENGLQFQVSILEGQKTGFFLDQREMREWVRKWAFECTVLNCFGYTGGFSVYAAAGGARKVDTVEISTKALEGAQKNMHLNGFSGEEHAYFAEDVFTFLREHPLDYGLVILDPPAFAKRQKDVVQACRGYKDINRLAFQKMPTGSVLITSSCSHYVDPQLFQTVIFQAAMEAGRDVQILGRHHLAPDHPIHLCHPEGDYLKSLVLYLN